MNAVFSDIPEFWLNFGLHVLIVSTLAWLVCLTMRDPARRSFAAKWGVMAILVLPWLPAAKPFLPERRAVEKERPFQESLQETPVAWPVWTIRIEEAPADGAAIYSGRVFPPRETGKWRWVMVCWMLGTTAGLACIALRQWKLVGWRIDLREAEDREWELAEKPGHGIPRHRLRVCGERVSPCVTGFFRPWIIVPRFLLEEGNEAKLFWALRHEAEHLRAGDSRTAVLLSLAKAVMWWNPVVHSLCARWAEDRERVCDAAAVAGSENARSAYAALLLDLAAGCTPGKPGAVAMAVSGTARRMRRRLLDVMSGRIYPARVSPALRVMVISAGFATGLLVSATGVRMEAGEAPSPGHARVEEPALEEEKAHAKPHIRISGKLFLTKEKLPEAGKVLDSGEQVQMLERVAAVGGEFLGTLPSITMRDRQDASIEIIRTEDKKEFLPGVRFLGVILKASPRIRDRTVDLNIDFTIHYDPAKEGLHFGSEPDENFDWDTLGVAGAKADVPLESGQALILPIEWDGKGNLALQVCATAQDPSGKSVEHFGIPIDRSEIENTGMETFLGDKPVIQAFGLVPVHPPRPCVVRFSASVFEIPERDFQVGGYDFEFYPEHPDPFGTPFPREAIRVFREESKREGGSVKIQELDPVDVPSGDVVQPWAIFPKLRVKPRLQIWETFVSAEVTVEGWGATTFSNLSKDLQSTFDLGKAGDGRVRYLVMEMEQVRE